MVLITSIQKTEVMKTIQRKATAVAETSRKKIKRLHSGKVYYCVICTSTYEIIQKQSTDVLHGSRLMSRSLFAESAQCELRRRLTRAAEFASVDNEHHGAYNTDVVKLHVLYHQHHHHRRHLQYSS